jgi:hypothetical protein
VLPFPFQPEHGTTDRLAKERNVVGDEEPERKELDTKHRTSGCSIRAMTSEPRPVSTSHVGGSDAVTRTTVSIQASRVLSTRRNDLIRRDDPLLRRGTASDPVLDLSSGELGPAADDLEEPLWRARTPEQV